MNVPGGSMIDARLMQIRRARLDRMTTDVPEKLGDAERARLLITRFVRKNLSSSTVVLCR